MAFYECSYPHVKYQLGSIVAIHPHIIRTQFCVAYYKDIRSWCGFQTCWVPYLAVSPRAIVEGTGTVGPMEG